MIQNHASRGEKKLWIVLTAAAVLAFAAWMLWTHMRSGEGYGKAVVSCDGREVAAFDLSVYTQPVRVSMADLGIDVPVSFELADHRIRFVDVTCPDHLCEGFGFIGAPMQTAVCMPNRVSVSIIDP